MNAPLASELTTSRPTHDERAVTITVRFFAAAEAAAGVAEQQLTVPESATVADALQAVIRDHGAELARVLDRCSYLHNAVAVHDHAASLADGDQLDVLPPFAGG